MDALLWKLQEIITIAHTNIFNKFPQVLTGEYVTMAT